MYQRCGGVYCFLWSMHIYHHILNCSLQPRSSFAQNVAMHSVFKGLQFVLLIQRNLQYFFISLFLVLLNGVIIAIIIKWIVKIISGTYYYSRKMFLFYEPQGLISVTKMSYWTYLQEKQSSLYFQTIFIQVKFQYSCPLYAYGSQVALSPSGSVTRNCDRIPSRDV